MYVDCCTGVAGSFKSNEKHFRTLCHCACNISDKAEKNGDRDPQENSEAKGTVKLQ